MKTQSERHGAIGWSLLYLLLGGGLVGAILVFLIARMLGG